jgi:hypothetical protein
MSSSKKYNAPRFENYLKSKKYKFLARNTWESLKNNSPEELVINLSDTQLSSYINQENFIDALIKVIQPSDYELRVYRSDPNDEKPFNTDLFHVYEDIHKHFNIPKMVTECSTSIDTNFNGFLSENVVIAPQVKDDKHWQIFEDLPEQIKAKAMKMINESGEKQ